MQHRLIFMAAVYPDNTFEFVDTVPPQTPSTAVHNSAASVHVFWVGRSEAEMVDVDALVIPLHNQIMETALGQKH